MEFIRFDIIYITGAILAAFLLAILFNGFFFWQKGLLKFSKSFNFNISFRDFVIKMIMLSIGAILLILALLGPSGEILSFRGASSNVIFLIDISKSMDALDSRIGDQTVSRLDKAKSLMSDFIVEHRENNYSIAVFAGDTVTVSPLTSDSDQILTYLSGINTSMIRLGGSDINKALDFSISLLGKQKNGNIVLFSNGFEDTINSFNPENFAERGEGADFKIFTVGLGTADGSYIPSGVDITGNPTYKMYNGSRVITKLDKDGLNEISKAFRGRYVNANDAASIDLIDKELVSVTSGSKEMQRKSSDIGYYFIVASFLFISMGYLIQFKKRIGKRS